MSENSTETPKKYHPALVALHWLIVILIFTNVFLAGAAEDGGSLAGIPVINFHMTLGITILLLMIVRLVVRLSFPRPARADTGNALLNKFGEFTHWMLYLLAIAMPVTGIILASETNNLARLFGQVASQPAVRFGVGRIHGLIWALLFLLLLLHIGAAMYHQFFIKDNLLKRMSFGKK